jgi:hypothetical protein
MALNMRRTVMMLCVVALNAKKDRRSAGGGVGAGRGGRGAVSIWHVVAREVRFASGALAAWAAAIAVVVVPGVARGDCRVSDFALGATAQERTRDSAILEAGELAANGRWPDARGVYLWVLARYEDDPEALQGLARVDAWDGCWSLSESEFRRVLAMHPEDGDVRAAYVDMLVWRGRTAEAQAVLAQGAGGTPGSPPSSPPLLARAAQFAYWRGDATTGVALADRAEQAAPDDGDIRAIRDRMLRGEARLTTHLDAYPGNTVLSVTGQVLQHVGRFELWGGAQLLTYFTPDTSTKNDVRYLVDVAYHPALGVVLGAEVALGLPAHAIPDFAGKVWATVPLVGPLDATLAYTLWHFAAGAGLVPTSTGEELVHIINPSLGVALPREIRLEGRAWISAATTGGQTRWAGAAGAQITWTPTARFSTGVSYTYGTEADAVTQGVLLSANPVSFLEYKSHVAGAYVDWLLDRKVGLRPFVGFERREDPAGNVIWIASVEVGVYARW